MRKCLPYLTASIISLLFLLGCSSPPPATEIPTPTDTPPLSPMPARIPTATPEPTADPGSWRYRESTDALTRTERISSSTVGKMLGTERFASLYEAPTLILRCNDGKSEVFVHWGGRFIAENIRDTIPIDFRVGDGGILKDDGSQSTNNESSFLGNADRFAIMALKSETLVIRATSYDQETFTAEFNTTGLKAQLDRLGCFGKWP